MNEKWTKCLLGDVLTLKRGYDLPKSRRVSGRYPIVSSSGISGSHNEAKVKGPGVVTGRYGTLGEVFYIAGDFWPLNTSLYVQNFKGNNPHFISYFLRTLPLKSQNVAGAVPGVNRNYLHMLPVCKPPLLIQNKITSILSTYDKLIENNLRRIKILEEMAQNLYQEWFVKFRFPGHEKVRMVDSPLGKIPKGWKITTISKQCCFVSRGVTPKYQDGSGRFIINQKVNKGGKLETQYLKELSQELKVPDEKLARYGDLLINSLGEGTIGRVNYFIGPDKKWAVDQHMSICRSENSYITNYLYQCMSSNEGQMRIQSLKTGATNMTMFNISSLRAYEVILPSENLLKQYARFMDNFYYLKSKLEKKISNLTEQRNLLLPKLISGELDVSELDIEIKDEVA